MTIEMDLSIIFIVPGNLLPFASMNSTSTVCPLAYRGLYRTVRKKVIEGE